jgi:hypothetical protein
MKPSMKQLQVLFESLMFWFLVIVLIYLIRHPSETGFKPRDKRETPAAPSRAAEA